MREREHLEEPGVDGRLILRGGMSGHGLDRAGSG